MKRQLSPLRASTEHEQNKKQYPFCPHCEAPTQEECVCVDFYNPNDDSKNDSHAETDKPMSGR